MRRWNNLKNDFTNKKWDNSPHFYGIIRRGFLENLLKYEKIRTSAQLERKGEWRKEEGEAREAHHSQTPPLFSWYEDIYRSEDCFPFVTCKSSSPLATFSLQILEANNSYDWKSISQKWLTLEDTLEVRNGESSSLARPATRFSSTNLATIWSATCLR